jgi:hypothetical protein
MTEDADHPVLLRQYHRVRNFASNDFARDEGCRIDLVFAAAAGGSASSDQRTGIAERVPRTGKMRLLRRNHL